MSISPLNNQGVIQSELWLVYMTLNPAAVESKPQTLGIHLKCYDYNYRAACQLTPCPYLHRCFKCNNMHPAIYCFNSQPTFNQNPSNVQRPFRASIKPKNTMHTPFQPSAPKQLKHRSKTMGPGLVSNTSQFNRHSFEWVPRQVICTGKHSERI